MVCVYEAAVDEVRGRAGGDGFGDALTLWPSFRRMGAEVCVRQSTCCSTGFLKQSALGLSARVEASFAE
jgi:hypothetical protein